MSFRGCSKLANESAPQTLKPSKERSDPIRREWRFEVLAHRLNHLNHLNGGFVIFSENPHHKLVFIFLMEFYKFNQFRKFGMFGRVD